MSAKEISAKQIILDLQTGLADNIIMRKYELSSQEYKKILKSLEEADVFSSVELEDRMRALSALVDVVESRHEPRCYLAFSLKAHDVGAQLSGEVQDLTERGCQIVDIRVDVGDKKTFRVEAEGLSEFIRPFSFGAECKWVRTTEETGTPVAGFEITNISGRNLEALRKTIQLLTLCDRRATSHAT
jgi:hypothetical protein